MSLKTRLRVLIILLIVTIVVTLSILNVSSVVRALLDDVLGRAELTAQQVQATVQQRLAERSVGAGLTAGDTAELRRQWTQLVATDPVLPSYLFRTLSNAPAFIEIAVEGSDGRVLVSSDTSRVGRSVRQLSDFSGWIERSLWPKIWEVVTRNREYVVSRPLSVVGQEQDLFVVRVVISSVLLRELIVPEIRDIGIVSAVSLAVSLLLAILVSNLALQPLSLISDRIDEIVSGKTTRQAMISNLEEEIATVQTKLAQLGEQYSGARQDARQLRNNIDRMLQRLEEAVLIFDAQGYLVMAGRPAERLLGIAQQNLVSMHYSDIFPSYTAQGGIIHQAIRNHTSVQDYPVTLERSGLPTVRLIVNLERLENLPNQDATGTIVTLRDADTRRELESQLDTSTRLLAINRLTGGVAHEIRNPLNAIMLQLEVLKTKLNGQAALVESEVKTITREIGRLDKVVRTFLDFTKPVNFSLRAINLHELTCETISLLEPQAQANHISIENLSRERDATIQGDWDSLKQALMNIIVNGIEASKKEGTLSVNVQHVFDECIVTIRDNGAGIAPEIQDKIFNLYFTTKEQGSGIGLAVTFQVVQLHNGNIDFTSELGKGTTFRLRFPHCGIVTQEASPVQETQPAH